MRVIAIDWSGRAVHSERTIWLAEAADGQLVSLENGRDREQLADWLIAEARHDSEIVVGMDFAFSMPRWYMRECGFADAPALWAAMHGGLSEELLAACEPPFWGRAGKRMPPRDDERDGFRATDRAHLVGGIGPKSVFQIGGAGAVGTGSLRGMPVLHRLREAGFSIWPFCETGGPRVMEIYPRLLTGAIHKRQALARRCFIERHYPELETTFARIAASSEDAFDAAVSALVMSAHTGVLRALPPARDERESIEGRIWAPEHATCDCA